MHERRPGAKMQMLKAQLVLPSPLNEEFEGHEKVLADEKQRGFNFRVWLLASGEGLSGLHLPMRLGRSKSCASREVAKT